jgi:predicted phage terminase large subunit-like protein
MHAHLLIIDDPIDPAGAISDAEMLSANKWMDETLSTRKVDKEVSLTILIMQRLHQNDCTANMLKKGSKVKHICLPAERSEHVKPQCMNAFYLPDENGNHLMDLKRLTKSTLEENEKKLGQYGFAGQFGQHPVPPGGGMFKTDRITITPCPFPTGDANSNKWNRRFARAWDKAATADGGCYTAGVKLGLDHLNRLWILNVQRGQWDTDVREAMTKRTAILDGYNTDILLEQEPGSGGKDSTIATGRNLIGYKVIHERPTGNKIYRADPFSVQVNNGNVYMVPGEWNQDFLDEMKFFPLSTYKDQIDASSAAANHLMQAPQHAGAATR